MKKKSSTIKQYRCEKCNAPYPLGADDVIATCPYCGYTFTVGGEEIKHFALENKLNLGSAKKVVMNWLDFASRKTVGSGILKNIEIEEPKLQWMPAFRVEGDFKSYHFGYKTEGSGDSRKYRRFEEHGSGNLIEWVLARRHAATFGIDEFILSIDETPIKKFTIEMTENTPVLNSEINDDDAIVRASRNRKERERVELLEMMDKLLDHQLTINPKSCSYTHTPYWLVRYSYQKGTFRVALSGATGKVLLGELPVTKRYRAKKWFASLSLLISSSVLFQILPYTFLLLAHAESDEGDFWIIPFGILALACLFWIGSIASVRGALKYEVQVNEKGEERKDDTSLESSIRKLGGKFT